MALTTATVTIAAGQSLSGSINVTATATQCIGQILMPPVWEGDPQLTFQGSTDGLTFYDIYNTGGILLAVKVIPNSIVFLEPAGKWRSSFFKFRSGTAKVPTIQTAARVFTCVMYP